MMVKLNDSMFDLSLDKESESIDLDCWVHDKDHSFSDSNILKVLAQTLDAENLLTVMEVVQCLWQASTTGTTIRDGPSNFELCSELGATRLEMG